MALHASDVIDLLSDSEGEEGNVLMGRGAYLSLGSGHESSDEDDLCCPITEEPYQEKGPHQPLILPSCGHTFSRATVEGLLKLHKQKRLVCPLCNTKQTSIQKVDKCPPNWDTIRSILQKTERRKKRAARKVAANKVTAIPAQRIAEAHVPAPIEAPVAGTSHKRDTPVLRRKRPKAAIASREGEAAPGPKPVKKKKSKASSTKKPATAAQPVPSTVAPSPLMEKVQKAEFDARAVKVLGQAHKKRR